MTKKITIKNCQVINEGEIFESDLLIEDGRISKIDSSIETQGDELWWGGGFVNLDDPYFDMLRLIRGYDPNNRGLASGKYGITLDGGDEGICAALFQSDGKLLETIQKDQEVARLVVTKKDEVIKTLPL